MGDQIIIPVEKSSRHSSLFFFLHLPALGSNHDQPQRLAFRQLSNQCRHHVITSPPNPARLGEQPKESRRTGRVAKPEQRKKQGPVISKRDQKEPVNYGKFRICRKVYLVVVVTSSPFLPIFQVLGQPPGRGKKKKKVCFFLLFSLCLVLNGNRRVFFPFIDLSGWAWGVRFTTNRGLGVIRLMPLRKVAREDAKTP